MTTPSTIAVGTYNVERGGEDRNGARDRWHAAVALASQLDIDVLCVQEARGWASENDGERLFLFAAALDATPFVAPSPSGYDLAIFVRKNIRVVGFRANPSHLRVGAAMVNLHPDGWPEPITVLNAHLDPWDGEIRRQQAASLTWIAGRRYGVLGGDLNCIGVNDEEPDFGPLSPELRLSAALPDSDPRQPLFDRRAAQRLQRAGLVDAGDSYGQHHRPTCGWWPSAYMPVRKDHLWLTRPLAGHLTGYEVFDSKEIRAISDHGPVRITVASHAGQTR